MLTKIPNILGRNFVIGFFTPSLFFIIIFNYITEKIGLSFYKTNFFSFNQNNLFLLTTNLGLLSFFIGIILLVINRSIIRFFEGYGKLNPLQIFLILEKRIFKRIKKRLKELDKIYLNSLKENQDLSNNLKKERNNLLIQLSDRFPDNEDWLLPTSFGNIIRAFEVYPKIMYGIDSVCMWSRLIALIPPDYLNYIENAESKVHLWINILLLDILLLVYVFIILLFGKPVNTNTLLIFIGLEFLIIFIAYFNTQEAAVEWGKFVKSAFDLYSSDLLEKLRLSESTIDIDKEKQIWHKLSQAYIYKDPKILPYKDKNQELKD